IATTASPDIVLGAGTLTDSATVSGRVNPLAGASVEFRLYGPNDATCATAIFTSTVPYPQGGGSVTSAAFTPTTAGTYRWRAFYSGDANNAPVSGACNAANETTEVARSSPTLATVATSVTLPGTISDSATLTGPAGAPVPTGSVTFVAYGPVIGAPPVPTCGTTAYTSSAITLTPGVGNSTASSTSDPAAAAFAPTAGTYYWVASYSGDANYLPTAGTCGAAGETSTVTAAVVVPAPCVPPFIGIPGACFLPIGPAVTTITVTNTATPTSRPEPGGSFSYAVVVANSALSSTQVTIASLVDSVYGDVSTQGTCTTAVGTVLAIGGTYSCSFPGSFTGNAGASQTSTVTATATGAAAPAADSETVTLTNVAPTITVDKTATPTSRLEPGGEFTFSVLVTNTSFEPVTITSITDDIYGNLATRAGSTCTTAVGTVLAPGGTYTCSFTGLFSGVAGASQTAVVTVTAVDNDATAVVVTDSATVGLTPAVGVVLIAPALTGTAVPSAQIGSPITDTAVLAGGTNPTGTLTFSAFGPASTDCTGTPVFNTVQTVTGNGTYTSASFVPSDGGTFRWVVSYSGDAAHAPVATACNAAGQSSSVFFPAPIAPPAPPPVFASSPPTAAPTVSPTPTPVFGSAPSPAPSSVPPLPGVASVRLSADRTVITAGATTRLVGQVLDSAGRPVPAVTLSLLENTGSGWRRVPGAPTVVTDANGLFSQSVRPVVRTAYGANIGDAVRSNVVNVQVHLRIDLDAVPTPIGRRVPLSGVTAPDAVGQLVGLRLVTGTGTRFLGESTVGLGGRFTVDSNVDLAPGRHTVQVYVSATRFNLRGVRTIVVNVG
ncbi:MAG TPA: hypothetical protein VNA14_11185, partial [Mycobacteriales bacterium]|nr:hypothetical protein [Mycobacteriales bacterium]